MILRVPQVVYISYNAGTRALPDIPYWLFYSRDDIFTNFMKKVAFRENIIVNSCVSVALLHLKQSAS